jgi:long-chain acyl-CoA synthetase
MLHTIQDYVDHQAQERPDAVYLVAPETGHTLTFAGLQRSSRRLANYLAALGIGPGETVALLTHNGYQGPRLLIGAMYGGRCIAPLNLLAQPSQLEYVLDHCDARIVFASPDQVERLNGVLGNIAREIKIVACDVDAEEFIDAPDTAQRRASVAAEDDALMVYTSGTTGRPKGVILAHRSVVAGGRFVSEAPRLTPSDRAMAVLPLYHINAQIVTAAAPLVHGGSLVLPHRSVPPPFGSKWCGTAAPGSTASPPSSPTW